MIIKPFIRFLLVTGFIFFNNTSSYCQATEKQIDSLNQRAFVLRKQNTAEAFKILKQTEEFSKQINYKKGLAVSYLYEGGIFSQSGFNRGALTLFYKARSISLSIQDTFNAARSDQQIAAVIKETGELKKARSILINTLSVYIGLKKFEDAINCYNNIGVIELESKKYDAAKDYFFKALTLSNSSNYFYGKKKSLYNLGLYHHEVNALDSAIWYLNESLQLNLKEKDFFGLSQIYQKLALSHYQLHQIKKGIAYAEQASMYADSSNAIQLKVQAKETLALLLKQQNNTDQTIALQQEIIALQKQLYQRDKKYILDAVEILQKEEEERFIAEKTAQEAAAREKTNIFLLSIAALIILGLIFLGIPLVHNYRKVKAFSKQLQENTARLDQMNKIMAVQNEKLEKENSNKDRLLSIISHDLRIPLVNTKSLIDLINLKIISQKDQPAIFEQLEAQYARSISLLDNLLIWIKAQMQKAYTEPKNVVISDAVNKIIEEQKIQINAKKLKVQNDTDKHLIWFADEEMIGIVVRNLLSNAIKFTPSEGAINVYNYSKEQHGYLVVQDSGVGIPASILEKINAQQYFTTKGTANEKGSGFGLMLIRDMLEKNNAHLIIESEPGRGSKFIVQFPLPDRNF